MKTQISLIIISTLLLSCESNNIKIENTISQMKEINNKSIEYNSLILLYTDSAKVALMTDDNVAGDRYVRQVNEYKEKAEELERDWVKLKKSLPKKYRSMLPN